MKKEGIGRYRHRNNEMLYIMFVVAEVDPYMIFDMHVCMWLSHLSTQQNKAQRDRERYESEMSYYQGPLKVPRTRMKRHPEAPKRVMSAFLHFSKLMKPQIKSENEDMSSADVVRILAERWKSASKEEKMPYLEKEREEK